MLMLPAEAFPNKAKELKKAAIRTPNQICIEQQVVHTLMRRK